MKASRRIRGPVHRVLVQLFERIDGEEDVAAAIATAMAAG
jgi:hypothetical protein